MEELATPLSEEEIGELDAFLLSDQSPEKCMDVSMLDGFLTALVLSPARVEPARWLAEVWGEHYEGRTAFGPKRRVERIITLITRMYNGLATQFSGEGEVFSPVLYEERTDDGTVTVIDEWCMGFMRGVSLEPFAWEPLVGSEDERYLLAPMFHYGTTEGWEQLERDPVLKQVPHEEWVEMLQPSVNGIREFWANRAGEKE